MHVNEAEDGDYDGAFAIAQASGIDYVNVHLLWGSGGASEPSFVPLTTDADGAVFDDTLLDIINIYYPAFGMPLMLTIGTIDTNNKFVPSGLAGAEFDDATMIARFEALLDHVLAQIPDVTLVSLHIGNEVDAYLGTDAAAWGAYGTFLAQVAAHARTLRPGLKVSVTGTFRGLTEEPTRAFFGDLLEHTDHVSVTYYPLNDDFSMKDPAVVMSDLASIVGLYPSQPIYFAETGYSSGSAYVGSSLAEQATFVRNVFRAWDTFPTEIAAVSFLNLHEWSDAKVDDFGTQYAICPSIVCEPFKEYLQTLGLRTSAGAGADKPAFSALVEEAAARGW